MHHDKRHRALEAKFGRLFTLSCQEVSHLNTGLSASPEDYRRTTSRTPHLPSTPCCTDR
ncbi:hypothetical protein BDP55DRAFT_682263 [Colletotrichum godetiae]|uniref:Uncharacterized protein n=1 Tax=Colletotrichum godetiae TaxID=1209918 RepID=A0AAJ0EPE7_9PEZI|nr:uncharacterized protein BDP55DRAFT_682263 [Colletotrichum godetiae]KAK1658502.1 hypothetical protein BDP55DRAFT_682263 [Colletotrichum godetiae]